jgi:hypothetical protein
MIQDGRPRSVCDFPVIAGGGGILWTLDPGPVPDRGLRFYADQSKRTTEWARLNCRDDFARILLARAELQRRAAMEAP